MTCLVGMCLHAYTLCNALHRLVSCVATVLLCFVCFLLPSLQLAVPREIQRISGVHVVCIKLDLHMFAK